MRHLAFLAVVAAGSIVSAADRGLTTENYNKIDPGASIGFAYGCLGKETSVSSQSRNKKPLVWQQGKTTIRLKFENDKVVGKSQAGLK